MREDTVDIEDDDAIAMDGNHTENAAPRSIGLLSSINLVLGQIVGSGVFASPGIVLNLLQGHYISSLITWLLGGLITIAGGLVYAELGSTFQHSGGDHTYIHMAFGSLPSFLYDWTVVLLGRPGGVAVDAVVFGEYVVRMVGYRGEESDRELAEVLKRLSAIACVVLLTAVNAVSGKWGTTVGDVSTILKMIALFSIGITAPYFYFHPLTPLPPSPPLPTDPRVFALSLYSVLFAYDGFNNLNNVAGEVKDPSRTFPRAVVIACSLVTASYVLANVAYLGVIGVDGVRGSVAVVVDFGVRLFGPAVGHLFPVIVLVATLGACNATIFTACRTLAKVAHDGNAPSYFAVIDGRTGVPFRALIFQAVVSSALILIGSYEELVNLLAPTGWLSYATTTLSLLRFRYTHPDVTRPYRVPTVIAIMFLATAVSLVVTGVAGAPREGLASLGVLVLGSVVWWIGVRNGGDVRGCLVDVSLGIDTLLRSKRHGKTSNGVRNHGANGRQEHAARASTETRAGWNEWPVWPWNWGSRGHRYTMLGEEEVEHALNEHGLVGSHQNGLVHSKAKISSNDIRGESENEMGVVRGGVVLEEMTHSHRPR